MADEQFRPLPYDPSAVTISEMFDARADDWVLTAPGAFEVAAVEAMRSDGSGYQRLVVVQWDGRRNHTKENVKVRLMLNPDDADGLADMLAHTAKWLRAVDQMSG